MNIKYLIPGLLGCVLLLHVPTIYAAEGDTTDTSTTSSKFDDPQLLIDTLTAYDQKQVDDAQKAVDDAGATINDLTGMTSDEFAQLPAVQQQDIINGLSPEDQTKLNQALSDLQTAQTNLENAQTTLDDETKAITDEVGQLSDEQVTAMNQKLNNAVNSKSEAKRS